MKRVLTVVLAVAALAGIAAFLGTAKAPSATAAVSCGTEATIGYFGPTTGPVASIGEELRDFTILYAQEWNDKGKKPKMNVVEGDTEFDPAKTSTAAQGFASNADMLGVIGPGASQEVIAAGSVFKKAGMAFVAASATRTTLTNGSIPTFLRIAAPDAVQANSTVAYLLKLKVKSVVAIDDQSAYGKPLADEVAKQLKAKGVSVKRTSITQKQSDFSAAINSLPGDTDLVYLAVQLPQKMQLFGVQLKEQGKGKIRVFLSDAGGNGVKLPGAYFSTFGPDVHTYGPAQPILKDYHAKNGKKAPLTAFGPLAYVSGQVVVDAVARACKDGSATRAEVLTELHKTNLKTSIFGDPISFNAHGDRVGARFFTFQITKTGVTPVG